ncbi:MAG: hypothetical protein JWN35_1770 [Frankiales bacterium]|nr:hypothetical protein [Frankiales bacterium]
MSIRVTSPVALDVQAKPDRRNTSQTMLLWPSTYASKHVTPTRRATAVRCSGSSVPMPRCWQSSGDEQRHVVGP